MITADLNFKRTGKPSADISLVNYACEEADFDVAAIIIGRDTIEARILCDPKHNQPSTEDEAEAIILAQLGPDTDCRVTILSRRTDFVEPTDNGLSDYQRNPGIEKGEK